MSTKCAPLGTAEREIVQREIIFWHRKKWLCHALVVMPTHVHILATPLEAARGEWYSLSEILHSVKLGSARRINRHRETRGPVWCVESYDHIIRSDRERSAAFDYILHNPSEHGFSGDPYTYDGFWCESMQGLMPELPAPPGRAQAKEETLRPKPVAPRVPHGAFVQRRRYLPHWERPGATYHVTFALRGHRVPGSAAPDQ